MVSMSSQMRCAEIGANPDRTCKMVRSPAQRPPSASPTAFSHLLCNDPWGLSAPHSYISCTTHQRNFAVQLSPQVLSSALQYFVRELRRSAPHGPPSQAARRAASDALARISAPCRRRPTRLPQPDLSAAGTLCLSLSGSRRSCCSSVSVWAPRPTTRLRHPSLERSTRAVFRSSVLVAVAAPSPRSCLSLP